MDCCGLHLCKVSHYKRINQISGVSPWSLQTDTQQHAALRPPRRTLLRPRLPFLSPFSKMAAAPPQPARRADPPRLPAAGPRHALPPPLPTRASPRSGQRGLRCVFPAVRRNGDWSRPWTPPSPRFSETPGGACSGPLVRCPVRRIGSVWRIFPSRLPFKKNLPLSFPHFIPLFLSLFYSLSFLFPFIVSL